jgi:hypothetical protein
MNYQAVSKQQLLAERARLQVAHRKAEQRLATGLRPNALGGGVSRPGKGSSRTPQREIDQLAAQLASVETELERREQAGDPSAGAETNTEHQSAQS